MEIELTREQYNILRKHDINDAINLPILLNRIPKSIKSDISKEHYYLDLTINSEGKWVANYLASDGYPYFDDAVSKELIDALFDIFIECITAPGIVRIQ